VIRLSPEAVDDIRQILLESEAQFGPLGGTANGHKRRDIRSAIPLRFEVVRPFVVAFDPETRTIVRVIHGARDTPGIFGE
jgi:plasmid stabilization system protein ParE